MNLNDFLFISPTIFDDGWEERPPLPMPPPIKAVCGELVAFFNPSKQIGVNISLEDKNGPPYLHLSIRHNGMQEVTNDEALEIIDTFFPGMQMAKNQEEFLSGKFWGERRGVGFFGLRVRHFSKMCQQTS